MKVKIIRALAVAAAVAVIVFSFSACTGKKESVKMPVKVLFLPHFEVGEMSGDEVGEAQLLYEKYFLNCIEYSMADGTVMYYSPENELAMYVTGSGKTNASKASALALSDVRFDMSDAYIIGLGCAGGAKDITTLGDVCIATSACDYDLGHTIDARELDEEVSAVWYHDSSFDDISFKKFNTALVDRAYELTKDTVLETTDITRSTMKTNFGDAEWATRNPVVIKGACITSDRYWKGEYSHNVANDVLASYDSDEVYTITEMEDVAIADVVDSFGMLDKLLIVRANVNPDVFINGNNAFTLWEEDLNFNDAVGDSNEETLDIFEPAMRNNYNVISTITDAILNGTF